MRHSHKKRHKSINRNHNSHKNLIQTILLVIAILAVIFALMYSDLSSSIRSIFNKQISESKGKITSCTDLASVEKDYFSEDTVQIKYNSGISDLFGDYCKDSVNLVEYSCNGNSLVSEEYTCDAGCYKGACISPKDIKSVYNTSACGDYFAFSPVNAVSRSQFGAYSPLNAIDQDLLTRWYGNPRNAFPKWIYFDLGNKKCISQLDLYAFSEDLPITLKIQASHDTAIWTTIKDNVTLSSSSTPNILLPSNIKARYIRIVETSSAREYGSLSEIRLMVADPKQ